MLGTFVEIQAFGTNAAELEDAVDAAFLAIAHVQRLMSFHDPESEVSRMNRDACYKRVRVHPWTGRVLKSAQEFSSNTDSIFDITMAGQLVKWNYLPSHGARFGRGNWRDIILEATGHVRFRRPLLIDFGGIAKGFAVDRAVEILKRERVTAGIVNAGGDLRVFGNRRRYVSAILDTRTGRSARDLISVTVGAADCMTADALTKVVFALRGEAAPLLARYSADALLLEQDGATSWMFHPTCDTSRQT